MSNAIDIPPMSNTIDIPPMSNTIDIPPRSNTIDIPPRSNTIDIPDNMNSETDNIIFYMEDDNKPNRRGCCNLLDGPFSAPK